MTKLDRTWKNCLRMWKWISENWEPGMRVRHMKRDWLDAHGFRRYLSSNCFFCQYALDQGLEKCDSDGPCPSCPGVLVSPRFRCRAATYSYSKKPKAFYRKLLALDKERRGK